MLYRCDPRGYLRTRVCSGHGPEQRLQSQGGTAATVTRHWRMVWCSNSACVFARRCRARLHVWDVSGTLLGTFQESSWKLPERSPSHSKPQRWNAIMFSMCVAACAAHVCTKPRAEGKTSSLTIAGPGMSLLHPPVDPSAHGWGQRMQGQSRCASRAAIMLPLRWRCSAAPRGAS